MTKIRILSEHSINQIAAGEVVEGPISVVKELVENALDSGATEITVEIQSGGRQFIRVTDNGCGMGEDDALLSLERHGTSKITEVSDLESVETMGFRGEAIPSIASVSKFTLVTNAGPREKGVRVEVEGGVLVRSIPMLRSVGTTVEVRSLFYNAPVRRKFQRSPAQDTLQIERIMRHLALANLDVRFHFVSNQKTLFLLPAQKSLSLEQQFAERVEKLLGQEFFKQLKWICCEQEGLHLQGFISLPKHSRPNKQRQYLFMNRRVVECSMISKAIQEGYGSALPTGRYPSFILQLELPKDCVDVNVHPQKREIRIRQEANVQKWLVDNVLRAFSVFSVPEEKEGAYDSSQRLFSSICSGISPLAFEKKEFPQYEQILESLPLPSSDPKVTLENAPKLFKEASPLSNREIPAMIGYLKGYLLLEGLHKEDFENEMVIMDQQAAERRILFERLSQNQKERGEVQQLLIPITLEFSPHESILIKEYLQELFALGVSLEEFGTYSFVVRSIPVGMKEETLSEFFDQILEEVSIAGGKTLPSLEAARRLSTLTAKITASEKRRLNSEEAEGLLHQLFKCQSSLHCPLGRSIFVAYSQENLQALFSH